VSGHFKIVASSSKRHARPRCTCTAVRQMTFIVGQYLISCITSFRGQSRTGNSGKRLTAPRLRPASHLQLTSLSASAAAAAAAAARTSDVVVQMRKCRACFSVTGIQGHRVLVNGRRTRNRILCHHVTV